MPAPSSSMRRDLFSAYLASGARVLSWVIVSAIVYRRSTEAFAMLALVRGTIGILNYAALGLLPAMIRPLADCFGADHQPLGNPGPVAAPLEISSARVGKPNEPEAGNGPPVEARNRELYASASLIALISFAMGIFGSLLFSNTYQAFLRVPLFVDERDAAAMIAWLGSGIALRWLSDPAAAVLQTSGRIGQDNLFILISEAIWVGLCAFLIRGIGYEVKLDVIGVTFFAASAVLALCRVAAVDYTSLPFFIFRFATRSTLRMLLSTGLLITLAQLADYLYAPTDYLLINHLFPRESHDLANYAPALQIDGGLMLLVTGIAAVLLPKAAIAHAAGNRDIVRAYYLRGTIATAAMLLAAGLLAWLAAPALFTLWLADSMPGTRAILPLVLIHTVIGGSSAVGRSILLGIGKAKPFTIAVLIAGATNVICSFVFVRYFGWGLRGIVMGTIVAVVARCGIWMPWYILRALRDAPEIHAVPLDGIESVMDPPAL